MGQLEMPAATTTSPRLKKKSRAVEDDEVHSGAHWIKCLRVLPQLTLLFAGGAAYGFGTKKLGAQMFHVFQRLHQYSIFGVLV